MLSWMTLDEVRKKQGLLPLSDGAGQVVPDLAQPEPKQSGLRNKLSSIYWGKKMSSIQYGKFELVLARNIRETEEIIVVPAILDRESILQYGNIRSYRPTNELQDAGFTPIALDKLLIPNPNIGDD